MKDENYIPTIAEIIAEREKTKMKIFFYCLLGMGFGGVLAITLDYSLKHFEFKHLNKMIESRTIFTPTMRVVKINGVADTTYLYILNN